MIDCLHVFSALHTAVLIALIRFFHLMFLEILSESFVENRAGSLLCEHAFLNLDALACYVLQVSLNACYCTVLCPRHSVPVALYKHGHSYWKQYTPVDQNVFSISTKDPI